MNDLAAIRPYRYRAVSPGKPPDALGEVKLL